MRSFGPWLRQQRKARGWTQEDLATRLACSASLIRKLEAGQRVASPEIAAQLAALLGIAAEERPAFVAFGRGHPLAEAAQRAPWPGPSRPPA
ncbi:MAG TPA: helix-turn-helix transcriptional regulator, partial [Chloroflexia bacterium]|nr:helix-turn-helix transcriptional regulator [Chloroflexia bacterium]